MKQFLLACFADNPKRITILLMGLLIVVCLYDLMSPPISVTIVRQTQTAMLTDNFLKEGFSLKGLYTNINGREGLKVAYEFPIYNFIVGLFFLLFGSNPFWGKLVSLFGACILLSVFHRLAKSISDNLTAFYAALFFIFSPINVLMSTSFQPDAVGLMFLLLSIFMLDKWRKFSNILFIAGFSVSLLLCGLCKYPLLVPYIPICILMFLFPHGKFKFPRIVEMLIPVVLFMVPFILWYMYRSRLTDPMLLAGESNMFLFGNLKRFLSAVYYVRPAIMLCVLIFCGTGIVYFIFGLRRIPIWGLTLLAGIPLYYIVVPTAANQYYYLYAIIPITAFFMARGVIGAVSYFEKHRLTVFNYLLCLFFGLCVLFGITYVLRMDKVALSASKGLCEVSKADDLIFVINMHDRGTSVGGINPAIFYFSNRSGWNIQRFDPDNIENVISQINSGRERGARWLVITWYTPDMEPWYSKYLPSQFRRTLNFDSRNISDKLKQYYPVKLAGSNFAILNLAHSDYLR